MRANNLDNDISAKFKAKSSKFSTFSKRKLH